MGTPFCQENAVRVAQRKKKRHFFEPFFLSQKSAVAAAKQRKRQKSWGGNNSAGMFLFFANVDENHKCSQRLLQTWPALLTARS